MQNFNEINFIIISEFCYLYRTNCDKALYNKPDMIFLKKETTFIEEVRNFKNIPFDNLENPSQAISDINVAIHSIELGSELSDLLNQVHQYFEELKPNSYNHRTLYFWQWIKYAFELTTHCITEERDEIIHLKMKTAIFFYALDDICDELKDEKLLKSIISEVENKTGNYSNLLLKLWDDLQIAYQNTPNYNKVKSELNIAYQAIFNSFFWIQKSGNILTTKIDLDVYLEKVSPTNCVYLAAIIELLFDSDLTNVKIVKEVALETQKMAQIGNWISTWQREVKQGDYSSGILIYLINNKYIEQIDLNKNDNVIDLVKKFDGEKYLMKQWNMLYDQIFLKNLQELEGAHLKSFKVILFMQLNAVGLI